ncbi:MAG: hypothetical protein KA176_11575 [Alphaproteobacteria bacterium]|nr:hypothetical protein [Alphaproteobacteria bacterium]MBP7763203.1 hypothetical protein [Alphaproteobacteria bacterium]
MDEYRKGKPELLKLMEQIKQEIMSGLRHGFFDYSLTGETKNGKRHVTFKAGKSYKFTIASEDIQE